MLYSLWRSVRTPNSKRQLPAPQYPGSPSAPQRASGQSLRYPNGSVTSTEPRCWPSYLDLTNPIQGATRTQALGKKTVKCRSLFDGRRTWDGPSEHAVGVHMCIRPGGNFGDTLWAKWEPVACSDSATGAPGRSHPGHMSITNRGTTFSQWLNRKKL